MLKSELQCKAYNSSFVFGYKVSSLRANRNKVIAREGEPSLCGSIEKRTEIKSDKLCEDYLEATASVVMLSITNKGPHTG